MMRKCIAFVSSISLAFYGMALPVAGQSQPQQPALYNPSLPKTEGSPGLQIVILEGEGALNNIRSRTAREPIIQVQDVNHHPIAGASVAFITPDSGPSGTFLGGTHSVFTTTDAAGKAHALGFHPNNVQGDFHIKVHVTYGREEANAEIKETNVNRKQEQNEHVALLKWLLAGGAGVGAGLGIYFAVRGNGPGATITAGSGTVNPP